MKRCILSAVLIFSLTGCDKDEEEESTAKKDACPSEELVDEVDALALDSNDDGVTDTCPQQTVIEQPEQTASQQVVETPPPEEDPPPAKTKPKPKPTPEPEPEAIADASLTVNLPSTSRTKIIDDNFAATFTYDGDEVECSKNGGSTYGPCTSDSTFEWSESDKGSTHVIRVTKEGADNSPLTYEFVPSTVYSGKTLLACDVEVTADEDFDTFEARLGSNEVICIGDGVTIFNTDTEAQDTITLSGNSNTIIVRDGDTATFSNTRTSGSDDCLTITGSGNEVIGASFVNDAGDGIYITGTGGYLRNIDADIDGGDAVKFSGNTGWEIHDSNIVASGNFHDAVSVISGATVNKISGSYLEADGSSLSAPLTVSGSTVTSVDNSELVSENYMAVSTLDDVAWEVQISDSKLRCKASTTVPCINADGNGNGGYLVVTDSVLYIDSNAPAIKWFEFAKTQAYAMVLDGVTFARSSLGSSDAEAIWLSNDNGDASMINSNLNNNRFCKESGSARTFSQILNSGTAQTWFDPSDQIDGGVVNDCPSGIFP